jgi:hypothetical protein
MNVTSGSHGVRSSRRSDQMALPMQPTAPVASALNAAAAANRLPPVELNDYADYGMDNYHPQPYPPVASAVSYPPVSPMPLSGSSPNPGVAAYPPAPDWAAPPEGRPIIRPPVGSSAAANATGDRRRTPMMPALAAEDLGIEESEFDKPTYLRRGLAAHGESNR